MAHLLLDSRRARIAGLAVLLAKPSGHAAAEFQAPADGADSFPVVSGNQRAASPLPFIWLSPAAGDIALAGKLPISQPTKSSSEGRDIVSVIRPGSEGPPYLRDVVLVERDERTSWDPSPTASPTEH